MIETHDRGRCYNDNFDEMIKSLQQESITT